MLRSIAYLASDIVNEEPAASFAHHSCTGSRCLPHQYRKDAALQTPRYAALAPFGKVAALLSELLPMSGTQHASTVRNRTRRVGEIVVRQPTVTDTTKPAEPVVGGLDGG